MYRKFFLTLMLSICIFFINTKFCYTCIIIESEKIHQEFVEKKLYQGKYNSAIQYLKKIYKRPISYACTQQIYLYLIYAYYQSSNFLQAQYYTNLFLKLHPTNQYIDYVLYMRGLIEISLNRENFLQRLFKINHIERLKEAFFYLQKLVVEHPNSKYSEYAYKELVIIKNIFAEHELNVIKFYYKRKAYVTVVKRSENMIKNFIDTKATYEALFFMKQAYKKLNMLEQSKKIENIIISNTNMF